MLLDGGIQQLFLPGCLRSVSTLASFSVSKQRNDDLSAFGSSMACVQVLGLS